MELQPTVGGDHGEGTATLSGRVYDDRGEPVADALVSLAGSGFWPARTVRSGTDGRFRWPGIPAGIYELRVSKGSLVAPPLEGLILDAGARRAFGVRLGRGWLLSGRVVDERTGRPIRGAEVTVATGALGLQAQGVETDRDGRFALDGIVGEEQTVYVEAEGYVRAGPIPQRSDAPPLTVRLERAARIEGIVVDERERPIEGAWVRAFGAHRAGAQAPVDSLGVTSGPVPPISATETAALAFVGQTQTSSDGRFVLRNVRPGGYSIGASHDAYAPTASKRVRVSAGEARSGIRLVLRPGAEVAGRVVDERGRALEAIPVELRALDEPVPRMSVTDHQGSFSFRGVRGEITITALPYDLPPAQRTLTIADDALVTVELALSSAVFALRGRAVDEQGFGVAGALVTVTSDDPQTPVHRTAKADEDGTFSVPALPPPPWSVRVEHPAFSPATLEGVDGREEARVVMIAGVTFIGDVVDNWADKPLRGVRVRLEGPVSKVAETRQDGTFVFRQLKTGIYEVTFAHDDYETQTRRVVIEPPRYVDRPQELETIGLDPGGVVEGEVVDAGGVPVPGAEVAWGEPARWGRAALTDARGAFQLRGVSAGSVWLVARHDVAGEGWIANPITVRPLETSPGALIRLPRRFRE